jgi:hypothetical protein
MAKIDIDEKQLFITIVGLALLVSCAGPPERAGQSEKKIDKYSLWTAGGTGMRGFMVSPWDSEEDFDVLESWNVNLVRIQIKAVKHKGEVFSDVFPKRLNETEQVVRWCRERGIFCVIDYHAEAGWDSSLWKDPGEHDRMVERWEEIAKRFRDAPNVVGYDLLNEPIHPDFPPLEPWPESGTDSWPALAQRVIDAIREIDPGTPIIIEPGPAGGMPGGFRVFPALDDDRLVVSFHMYQPHDITYQGIEKKRTGERWPMPRYYPGTLEGITIDKAWLARDMAPALEYSREKNVPVFVGEFSCVRWAPGDTAVNYLRDAIDLFEEYGWDWTYHAFREWPGWSLEHAGGPDETELAEEPTERLLLIQSYLLRNRMPRR